MKPMALAQSCQWRNGVFPWAVFQLKRFDHVNILSRDLAGMCSFYEEVVGLQAGPRPDFSFGGCWLYLGERAVVHLIQREGDASIHTDELLSQFQPQLQLQHFAFCATGLKEFLARLAERGIKKRIGRIEDFDRLQVKFQDPEGNHLHIDFSLAEADALGDD